MSLYRLCIPSGFSRRAGADSGMGWGFSQGVLGTTALVDGGMDGGGAWHKPVPTESCHLGWGWLEWVSGMRYMVCWGSLGRPARARALFNLRSLCSDV